MNEAVSPSGSLIEAVGLEKVYNTKTEPVTVLSGTDLRIQSGEIIGVIGASGVGKSTLLHILGGLDRPTAGQVFFRGEDIYRQKNGFLENYRNRKIGFVFQSFNLLNDFTALENTAFPALIGNENQKEATRRAEKLLEQVGLKNRMDHRPAELSGGESQRVALARALMNRPDLLLADEPTGNLDSHSSDELMDLILKLNEEYRQTFVIVTHSQRVAEKSHRIFELIDGQLKPVTHKPVV